MLNALAHFEQLKPNLSGDIGAREHALQQAERLGLPTRRSEPWHYTDLARLLQKSQSGHCLLYPFDAADDLTLPYSLLLLFYKSDTSTDLHLLAHSIICITIQTVSFQQQSTQQLRNH